MRARLIAIAPLALTLACEDDAAPGAIDLAWRTGLLTCAEAGVSGVRAELYDYGDTEPLRAVDRLCTDHGVLVESLQPGDYTVLLKGLDGDGCWTHEAREDVDIGDGEIVGLDLPLLRRTRPLWVRWPFENELDCQGNGVTQVQIRVDVEDRFNYEAVFLCPGLAGEIPVTVPAGALEVQVVALDARRAPVAVGQFSAPPAVFEESPCADRVEVRVPLSLCVNPGCQGEGP